MTCDPHQKQREADAAFWSGFRGDGSYRYSSGHSMGSSAGGRDPHTGRLYHQSKPKDETPTNCSGSSGDGDYTAIIITMVFFGFCGWVWLEGLRAFQGG